jgi:hypothetical protein
MADFRIAQSGRPTATLTERETRFTAIRAQSCSGSRLLVGIAITSGVNLDKPAEAGTPGNELDG